MENVGVICVHWIEPLPSKMKVGSPAGEKHHSMGLEPKLRDQIDGTAGSLRHLQLAAVGSIGLGIHRRDLGTEADSNYRMSSLVDDRSRGPVQNPQAPSRQSSCTVALDIMPCTLLRYLTWTLWAA